MPLQEQRLPLQFASTLQQGPQAHAVQRGESRRIAARQLDHRRKDVCRQDRRLLGLARATARRADQHRHAGPAFVQRRAPGLAASQRLVVAQPALVAEEDHDGILRLS